MWPGAAADLRVDGPPLSTFASGDFLGGHEDTMGASVSAFLSRLGRAVPTARRLAPAPFPTRQTHTEQLRQLRARQRPAQAVDDRLLGQYLEQGGHLFADILQQL